jgi:hypothetical protein
MFQGGIGRAGTRRARDGDDPRWLDDLVLMTPDDISQPSSNTISDHGRSDPAGSDKAAPQLGVWIFQNAEDQESPALCRPLLPHTREVITPYESL